MIKLVIMRKLFILFALMFFSSSSNSSEGSFYDFNIKSITGEEIKLSRLQR